MIKKLFVLSAFFAVVALAAPSFADVSYQAKKQGKVPFNKAEEAAASAQEEAEAINPADIEPAAGGIEEAIEEEKNSVAEDIKLPRKN